MNPTVIWAAQVLALFGVVIALPLGFYAQVHKIKAIKRNEMLKALHNEGEVEVIGESTNAFDMEWISVLFMANDLVQEGIISKHTRQIVRANRWERWQVYRLTEPKGVDLVTTMFGSAPNPPLKIASSSLDLIYHRKSFPISTHPQHDLS